MTKHLTLMDGTVFSGTAFGFEGEATGAIAVDSTMVGYIERLIDADLSGKIVIFTFPEIGNYGVPAEVFKEKITAKAVVINNLCKTPSNFNSQCTFDEWLKANSVAGIYGIDTRALAVHIRERGTQNGMVTTDLKNVDLTALNTYLGE